MIEKNVNEVLLESQPSTKALVTLLDEIDSEMDLGNVSLYHEFPLYLDEFGQSPIKTDLLLASQRFGLIIFECKEISDRAYIDGPKTADTLNKIDRMIFAKILKDAPMLQKGRRGLKVEITPSVYLNNCDQLPSFTEWTDFEVVTNGVELKRLIEKCEQAPISDVEYRDLKATIEGSKGLLRPTHRPSKSGSEEPKSKGAILTAIENDIYNFDLEQKRAALFTIDGAQRIRGLAGSGKTVILSMKAALLHLQNPNAEILYTYYTKSLYDLIRDLVTRFYRQFAERDPDWNKIHIMHAWGGARLEGVYYNACLQNGILPMTFTDAKVSRPRDPFGYVCEALLSETLQKQYDYSILDEGQDFPKHFYRLCRQITKNDRVIWAYDDFQNILNIKIQDEKETFGADSNGNYFIDFSRKEDELQDIVLHKCYRNPRKVLLSAFALGLGIYNKDQASGKPKIIQRLENNEHWKDLGFEVLEGKSAVGDRMVVDRPLANSPLIKNQYLEDDQTVRVISFEDSNGEISEVVRLILDDLKSDLKPEDISVIALDDRFARTYFTRISSLLEEQGVRCFSLLSAPSNNTTYKLPGHVTLSTIYRAKGNEAGSVYVVGVDAVFWNKDDITERNKIFTAMTRSHAWVTLTGVGRAANICKSELDELIRNNFRLDFIQPSEEDVRVIRQDLNNKQRKLNELERIKAELSKLGMSEEQILEHLFSSQKK